MSYDLNVGELSDEELTLFRVSISFTLSKKVPKDGTPNPKVCIKTQEKLEHCIKRGAAYQFTFDKDDFIPSDKEYKGRFQLRSCPEEEEIFINIVLISGGVVVFPRTHLTNDTLDENGYYLGEDTIPSIPHDDPICKE